MAEHDFEQYKHPWDCDEHWEIRKEFLERYNDTFPLDRLLCLAQVYTNIELLGCRYPPEVMTQINHLAAGLPNDKRSRKKNVQGVKFEKAKEDETLSQNKSVKNEIEENKCNENTSEENKTVENKSVESKSVENVSVENKSDENQSVATKSLENTSVETKSVETKTVEIKFVNSVNDYKRNKRTSSGDSLPSAKRSKRDNKQSSSRKKRRRNKVLTGANSIPLVNNKALKRKTPEESDSAPGSSDSVEVKNRTDQGAEKCTRFAEAIAAEQKLGKEQLLASSDVNATTTLFQGCGLTTSNVKLAMKPFKDEQSLKVGPGSNIVELTNRAFINCKLSVAWTYRMIMSKPRSRNQTFVCELTVNNMCIGQGSAMSKKEARSLACVDFLVKLETVYNTLDVQDKVDDVKTRHRKSRKRRRNISSDRRKVPPMKGAKLAPLVPEPVPVSVSEAVVPKDFVIFEEAEHKEPVNVLQRSSDMNKRVLVFNFELSGATHRCSVTLNNQLLAIGSDTSKAGAKQKAAIEALILLQQKCYTVKAKAKFVFDQEITKGNLKGLDGLQVEAIPDDNVGRKLLQQMGWKGGGLGKEGGGIAEPITVKPIKGRMGLGNTASKLYGNQFRAKFRQLLREYVRSGCLKDLVFTSEFSQEDRKILHEVAHKFGLRNQSYGKGEQRYLVISRKWNLQELVRSLIDCGGSSEKYQLYAPGEGEKWAS